MDSTSIEPTENAGTPTANLSVEDRMSAANREAQAEAEALSEPLQADESEDASGVSDEPEGDAPEEVGEAGEIDPEDEAEDLEAEPSEESEEVEEDADPVGINWDGDPDTVPDELRPGFDRQMEIINKGVNKRMRQLAEKEKQLDQLSLQYQQAMLDMKNAQVESPKTGRPKPPGEGATEADWQAYEDRLIDYRLEQRGQKFGGASDPQIAQDVAVMKQQQELQNRFYKLQNLPGSNDDVLMKMHDMAEADERYLQMYYSDDTAIQFFELAKAKVEAEAKDAELKKLKAESVAKSAATAKRKASAAKRATPRPGSARADNNAVDKFNAKAYPTAREAMQALNKRMLDEAE